MGDARGGIIQLSLSLLFPNSQRFHTSVWLKNYLLLFYFSKGSVVTDTNKPLRIPAGSDSFRSIQESKSTAINYSLDKYKEALLVYSNFVRIEFCFLKNMQALLVKFDMYTATTFFIFKQKNNEEQVSEDPARDPNFEEPSIDNLCQQKTEVRFLNFLFFSPYFCLLICIILHGIYYNWKI